jgi:methionyl-tRNA formyltransferase
VDVKKKYSIIFAGTPVFSVKTLMALINSGHDIKAVYTQPDRPSGRGRKLTASPVKELALEKQIPVYQPVSLRDENEQKKLASLEADVMIVVAYGLLLPLPILQAPKYGCINVHASLLPCWRGAAPIQRAILAGDTKTGVTIMQMDKGLDTGDMLYHLECPIFSSDTSAILHDRLAELGAEALLKTLDNLSEITPEKQNDQLKTYAEKISKDEAKLDWNCSAAELDRKIRAFNPWPVAETMCDGHVVRIWQAENLQQTTHAEPGEILQVSKQGIDIATGNGILRLLKMQLPGGKPLPMVDILNARSQLFSVGKKL